MRIMSQTKTLFVGIGGVGCKVVKALYDLEYSCLFVDCDIDDLNKIEVDSKYKYAVKLGDKTEGNRQQGKAYVRVVKEELNEKMLYINANARYVYFVFGMEGGFGGAVAPELLNEYTVKFNPNDKGKSQMLGDSRYFGVVPVIPMLKENVLVMQNILACYNELALLQDKIRNYMFLQDKYNDISMLASKFAQLINRFFTGGLPDRRGNISGRDMEVMMEAKGSVFMGEIEDLGNAYELKDPDDSPFIIKNEVLCNSFCISVGKNMHAIDWSRMGKRWIGETVVAHGYTNNVNTNIFVFGTRMPDAEMRVLSNHLMKVIK